MGLGAAVPWHPAGTRDVRHHWDISRDLPSEGLEGVTTL